ncbi:MAG: LamB/YcsF family protein [Candidatus Nanopelagicales bacterium]
MHTSPAPTARVFGRRSTAHSSGQLTEQLLSQALDLDNAAVAAGSAVTYIKPHGELYHDCIRNPDDEIVAIYG